MGHTCMRRVLWLVAMLLGPLNSPSSLLSLDRHPLVGLDTNRLLLVVLQAPRMLDSFVLDTLHQGCFLVVLDTPRLFFVVLDTPRLFLVVLDTRRLFLLSLTHGGSLSALLLKPQAALIRCRAMLQFAGRDCIRVRTVRQ